MKGPILFSLAVLSIIYSCNQDPNSRRSEDINDLEDERDGIGFYLDEDGNRNRAYRAQINESFNNKGSIDRRWFKHSSWESRCGVGRSGCLVTRYNPNHQGSPRLTWEKPIARSRSYSMVMDVKFANGFEFVKGGKLHGLGPKNKASGGGSLKKGAAQWSSRFMWRRNGRLVSYMYLDGLDGRKSKVDHGVDGRVQKDKRVRAGVWHALTLYVQLNDAGKYNGITQVYIDGTLISNERRVLYRRTNSGDSEIQKFLFSTFYGGNGRDWAPSKRTTVYLDNVYVRPGLWVRSRPGGNPSSRRP